MTDRWRFPRVFAHRGGGTLAPENTLSGFKAGVRRGFRAVEFDVMLTADGVPVLMHDPVFGRTVRARGSVAQTRAAELLQMDAGGWFDPAFDGEPVPSFEQALAYCREHQVFMNVEIKPAPGADVATAKAVAAMAQRYLSGAVGAAGILFSSFSADALAVAQELAPEVPRGLLLHRLKPEWRALARELDCVALHCNHEFVDEALVAHAHRLELGVFCYTVNTKKRADELRACGIDALCTDRIDLIEPDFFAQAA